MKGWNVTTIFFPVANVWAAGLRQNRLAKDTAKGKLDCEITLEKPLEYTSGTEEPIIKNIPKL